MTAANTQNVNTETTTQTATKPVFVPEGPAAMMLDAVEFIASEMKYEDPVGVTTDGDRIVYTIYCTPTMYTEINVPATWNNAELTAIDRFDITVEGADAECLYADVMYEAMQIQRNLAAAAATWAA